MTEPQTGDQAFLAVLDEVLRTPGDPEHHNRLMANNRRPYSDAARQRFLAVAKRRAELDRNNHFFFVHALEGASEPEAIAYMLDLLTDRGLAITAIGALGTLDPAVVAGPLRAWLSSNDINAVPHLDMLNRLRAVLDLAVPPADPATAVPVTDDMLETWIQEPEVAPLRVALTHGVNPNAPISRGETLLHVAVDGWLSTSDPESRTSWESVIQLLLQAGADPDRKLKRAFHSDLEWSAGTTPRQMIARERSAWPAGDEEFARLEALFPPAAPKASTKATKSAKAPTPKLLDALKGNLNGCADDVFQHKIRVTAVRYEKSAFVVEFADETTGCDDTVRLTWNDPIDTEEQESALRLALIDEIAGACDDGE